MYELKSCPFCGGILETRKDNMFQIYYAVHVPENYNCPLNNDEYMWENPLMRDLTEEDLIKKLNNRPLEEELQQRIADMEANLKLTPVSENPPPPNEPVLLIFAKRFQLVRMYIGFLDSVDGYYKTWADRTRILKVTHWLPNPLFYALAQLKEAKNQDELAMSRGGTD